MKHTFFLLLFLCSSYFLNAQSNYKEGYILSNEGDTIRGWIDYRTTEINCSVCNYKETENSEVKMYFPGEIAGYRFTKEGNLYISHQIELNNKTETVFLEFLIQGIKNLYLYKNKEDVSTYFFEGKDDKLIALSQMSDDERYAQSNLGSGYLPDHKYKGAMRYIFQDCPSIFDDINESKFDNQSMINLTKKYHQQMCTTGEKCIVYEEKPDKSYTKFKYSVYGGVQWQKLDIKKDLSFIACPIIGAEVDFSVPRWSKAISLLVDASFSTLKKNYDNMIKLDAWLINVKTMGKYTFGEGKIRPVIQGGIAMSYVNNSSSRYIDYKLTDFYKISTIFVGFDIGTGFNYMLKNTRALFLRGDFVWQKDTAQGKLYSFQLRTGYTF